MPKLPPGHSLPERTNPCCGYPITGADSLDPADPNARTPEPGDIHICLNCGTALTYTEDVSRSRITTPADYNDCTARDLRLVELAQRYIRARGRIWDEKTGKHKPAPPPPPNKKK